MPCRGDRLQRRRDSMIGLTRSVPATDVCMGLWFIFCGASFHVWTDRVYHVDLRLKRLRHWTTISDTPRNMGR